LKTRILPLIALTGLLVAACQTVPKSIPTTLTPAEYFQDAQQAVSQHENYDAALVYYDTFIKRFPNDSSRIAEAQYEIAFLYYKKGDLTKSRDLFTKIVDKYKQPSADSLPRWPLVLSNKLLIIIDNDLKKSNSKK
jgi:TolA-binding protein